MKSISYEEALKFFSQYVRPISETLTKPVGEALGFVLAEDVVARLDLPKFTNSAMDGWAFASADIRPEGFSLRNAGASFAGHVFEGTVRAGECIRIMTGGLVPDGCDTVVMQEKCTVCDDVVSFPADVKAGENVRVQGEEIRKGSVCLTRGCVLRPAHMNYLVALGVPEVRVYRKLRIGFFSTGDELVGIEEPLTDGKIYDSNRYGIAAMVREMGFEGVDFGRFPDNREIISSGVLKAAQTCDAVITSGGVSVGEADFTRNAILENGELVDWKCLIKPGKPLAAGKILNAYFFGLPGNPTAAQVTFMAVVSLALRRLSGETDPKLPIAAAAAGREIRKKGTGYSEFQRGIVSTVDGKIEVVPAGSQKTGAMKSTVNANCLIYLNDESSGAHPGDIVPIIPLFGVYS